MSKGQFYIMSKKLGLPSGKKPFPDSAKTFAGLRTSEVNNKIFAYVKMGGKHLFYKC